MYSLLINAWLCLLLAFSSATAVGSSVLTDALALLGGLQLLQLGSLSLLVYVATVWLEEGFLVTLKNVLKQLVAGERAASCMCVQTHQLWQLRCVACVNG